MRKIQSLRSLLLVAIVTVLAMVSFSGPRVHADQPLFLGRTLGSGVTVDSEGNLIVVGSSSPFSDGKSEMFLFKYVPELPDSPINQLSCMRTFGNGIGGQGQPTNQPLDTFGYSVAADSSDSIYVTGSTQVFGGENFNVFLQKYDQSCDLIYTLQWGGEGNDFARSIAVDALDNVYIVGSTDSFGNGLTQIFLLKYSQDGSLQFSETWGTNQVSLGNGVTVDLLGNVYVVGTTAPSHAGSQIVLLKYDSSGNLLYSKTVGGTENSFGTGVAVDSGGYVYVTGYSYGLGPNRGVSAVILIKYDPSGNIVYQKTWGGTQNDFATGVAADLDGNVYVTGYTKSFSINPGIPSAFLLKFNQAGNPVFQRVWGGNRGDFAYAVAVDVEENAYVTGYTFSFGPNTQGANYFILKYDISGNLAFEKLYGGGIPETPTLH